MSIKCFELLTTSNTYSDYYTLDVQRKEQSTHWHGECWYSLMMYADPSWTQSRGIGNKVWITGRSRCPGVTLRWCNFTRQMGREWKYVGNT